LSRWLLRSLKASVCRRLEPKEDQLSDKENQRLHFFVNQRLGKKLKLRWFAESAFTNAKRSDHQQTSEASTRMTQPQRVLQSRRNKIPKEN
jgi:hypothetical protein